MKLPVAGKRSDTDAGAADLRGDRVTHRRTRRRWARSLESAGPQPGGHCCWSRQIVDPLFGGDRRGSTSRAGSAGADFRLSAGRHAADSSVAASLPRDARVCGSGWKRRFVSATAPPPALRRNLVAIVADDAVGSACAP